MAFDATVQTAADLAQHVQATLAAAGRQITSERALRAAEVIHGHPNHWRQWRPQNAWDVTLDDLIAFGRATPEAVQ